jgi:hypothetical protein
MRTHYSIRGEDKDEQRPEHYYSKKLTLYPRGASQKKKKQGDV